MRARKKPAVRFRIALAGALVAPSLAAQPEGPQPEPRAASAPPSPPDAHDRRGFWFALRSSVGAPFGNALRPNVAQGATGPAVSEANTSAALLPLQLDAGYRITAHWRVGGYFQIADAFSGTSCSACGGYDARFGLTGEYHFLPSRSADLWLGLGAGYEILHTSTQSPGTATVVTAYRGFEYAAPEIGLDVRIGASRVRWGPWTSVAFAEYDHLRQISGSADFSITPSQTLHAWFFLGLRLTVDI